MICIEREYLYYGINNYLFEIEEIAQQVFQDDVWVSLQMEVYILK